MPKSLLTDFERASAFKGEKRQGTNLCVPLLRKMMHRRSSVGACLLLSYKAACAVGSETSGSFMVIICMTVEMGVG